jgi:TRAP transporter TAXI family solute receptor
MNALRRLAVLAVAAGLVGLLAPAAHAQKTTVIFSAGPTGGSWTPMAGATSEVIKKKFPELDVQVEPGAALVNMEKMRNDKADLAWSMTNVLSDALTGQRQWSGKKTDKPMLVATYYPNVWQLVVPADSGIASVKDLRGKPVALPARGNTSLSDGWEVVLGVNGMKLDDLGPKSYGPVASNAEAVKNRQALASGWFTVVPASFVLDLGSTMKLRMLGVSDDDFNKIKQMNPGFVRYTIKAGVYKDQGITDDVHTFQSPTVLIASSRTPADVIYKVTKAVVEGRSEFANIAPSMKGITPADMAADYGLPFHPGAVKYYKEIGALK